MQLKADITGRECVTLNVTESGCLAGAMLGGVLAGEYSSLDEATNALVGEREIFTPRPSEQARYAEAFATYQDLWPALRDVVHAIR